ncbi:DUF2760 domain-containing protein [Marinomonas posidonica]|uniref:DUF2760 domain-containing protein n=1 Tax=Marinomonas posidonica (strain CECT 7376 / NCIMB 14433 / IVIA-Po-181) TaxID=491952 RepID=F6CZB7_MARPP|nr:DUF2760 domain-containing protein [Marinomonas posidonica]AEF54654.1 hypothetical protein Mar181_1615 [Marinomonas posidonica IVIA-Po-181]
MSQTLTKVSFIPRFFGAFGQFFKYLSNGDYAARCLAVGQGEKLAFEVEPNVITEEVEVIREIEVAAPALASVNTDGALQLLQLLQQEARFIDFVQESIDAYSDEEVGAAARQIHAGSSKVLAQNFTLEVVNPAPENTSVTIPADYDAQQIKLEGRVEGTGPYSGNLIHSGWQVTDIRLPQVSQTQSLSILAPAEVEV